jgi:Ser/Thr protein kinase RdoA (MazF antagonist)
LLIDYSFFALSWKAPQEVDSEYRENLRQTYTKDLQLLLQYLPPRFHQITQKCLASMDAILSLPMVLLHRDFGTSNIMVDGTSCHLTGVIDWAEAELCPFGQNLHSLQALTGALHYKNGWRRYEGYEALQDTFWSTFQAEVGGLSAETIKTIKTARIMGLLRSRGFTKRLANMSPATPIHDDETGRYNMLSLDGFLIDPATRFDDLN